MSTVVGFGPVVFSGLSLLLFAAAAGIRLVRRARRARARRRAARRFLEKVTGPEGRAVGFIGYGPAGPVFHPDDDDEEAPW